MELAIKVGKEFVTSREAANMLGVALSTVQLWTENGLLRAWKTRGGHRRIARNSVERVLIEQRAVIDNEAAKKEMTLVIVEDESLLLQLYQARIAAWGFNFNIVTATNGFEGLMKIGRCLPDVIISDIVMPDMDGFQMINALKIFPELKNSLIVVVSILSEQQIRKKNNFTEENIVYFQKPVSFKKMKKLLAERIYLLTGKRALRSVRN